MLHYKTLKLVLQPLVENAVYHGFEDLDEGGMITIRAKVENGCGTFYVRDNGRGMPGEVLRKLGESGPGGGEGLGHGLMNVHERLVMYYGKRYGLRICSDADWGTLIQVRFPLNGGDEIEPGSDRG